MLTTIVVLDFDTKVYHVVHVFTLFDPVFLKTITVLHIVGKGAKLKWAVDD